jgi:hypothetical protein
MLPCVVVALELAPSSADGSKKVEKGAPEVGPGTANQRPERANASEARDNIHWKILSKMLPFLN